MRPMGNKEGLAQDSNFENSDEVTDVTQVTNELSEITAKVDLSGIKRADLQEVNHATDSIRELFHSVPLFNGMPDQMIQQIKGSTSIVVAPPDTEILKQGEYNANLYFLLLGNVEIYVDGGLVATLRRKGDLLGEMS